MTRITLAQVIDRLEAFFGKQKPPKLAGAWEMILWENVAYLANDDRRRQAFQILKKRIGTEPELIRSALDDARAGSLPRRRMAGRGGSAGTGRFRYSGRALSARLSLRHDRCTAWQRAPRQAEIRSGGVRHEPALADSGRSGTTAAGSRVAVEQESRSMRLGATLGKAGNLTKSRAATPVISAVS